METRDFQIELVSRQRVVYSVEAPDVDTARRIAVKRWERREPSDLGGLGWSEIETSRAMEAPSEVLQMQDDELLLRFIQERERLLLRLGSTFFTATVNDAISAVQAATDLGWYVPDSANDHPVADFLRSAQALERLCDRKRLICFERPRSREGERGEIRLYCTPEYLERLSQTIHDIPANAAS